MINKYPYTDFNEYNMDWIIKTVKDLTDQWAATHSEWEDVQTEWSNYKNYIDTYFANLDVQDEIDHYMNELIASGQFTQIVRPFFNDAIAEVPGIVSDWIDDNLMQEVGYVIDKSLTVENAAADAKTVGDIIFKEAEELNDMLDPVITYDDWENGGLVSSDGSEYAYANQIRTGFIVIGTDVILRFRGSDEGARSIYAFYYAKDKTFIQRKNLWSDTTTPAGTFYVRITYGFTSSDGRTIAQYGFANMVNDFNYEIKYPYKYKYLDMNAAYDHVYDNITWEIGTLNTDGSDASNVNYIRTVGMIPVYDNLIVYNPEGYRIYIAGFTSYKVNNLERFELLDNRYRFDQSVKYFRMAIKTDDVLNAENVTLTAGGIDQYQENKLWIALGDSITEGRANPGGGDPSIDKYEHCYANVAAKLAGYNLRNLADGNAGFLSQGSDSGYSLKDYIDNYSYTGADLVTIAMGVNDYINNQPLGSVNDTTGTNSCMAKLKYALANLGGNGTPGTGKAKTARVVVLLPMNANRDYPGNFQDTMNYNSNWYLNCRNNAGYTLQDMRDRIIEVCNFFGVEYIDLYEKGPLNRGNLQNLCGDGLHPTPAGHIAIGRALAHYFE